MITMLVTMDADNVIGVRDEIGLLWDCKVNGRYLAARMHGNLIVMGNNTYKALITKGENLIVMSKTEKRGAHDGAFFYNSLRDIIQEQKVFTIIGGIQMFHLFLPVADIVYTSTINLATTAEKTIRFPMSILEESFRVLRKLEPAEDIDVVSKLKTQIEFTQWVRKPGQIH